MSNNKRIALLVDGKNLSADHADFALRTAEREGTVNIRRVYGNLKNTGGWSGIPGFRVMHTPSGKNIADIALSLDALEIALTGFADTFFLATSDRDLALVALRLRELGHRVVAISEQVKVAAEFRLACHDFVPVPSGNGPAAEAKGQQTTPLNKPPFDQRMREFIRKEGVASDGWVLFGRIGQPDAKAAGISKVDAGIGKNGSWLDWFGKRPDQYQIENRGTQSRARLLRKAT